MQSGSETEPEAPSSGIGSWPANALTAPEEATVLPLWPARQVVAKTTIAMAFGASGHAPPVVGQHGKSRSELGNVVVWSGDRLTSCATHCYLQLHSEQTEGNA